MLDLVEEAIGIAINNEMNSYAIYRNATVAMPDGYGKQVFERLAREQSNFIVQLRNCDPDALPNLRDNRHDDDSDRYGNESPEHTLFKHLGIALLDKRECIDRYAAFLASFRDPDVCRVFQQAMTISRKQYERIAEEYRQSDLRLNRPAVNRRKKRVHIRDDYRPAPNEHSQLYISMVEPGRQSPF